MTSQGGKYQPAFHHPNCEDFKLEKFARVEFDGQFCVMEMHELDSFMSEADEPEQCKVSTVEITRDQFERMPELNGF
jgi:hypothetical protein